MGITKKKKVGTRDGVSGCNKRFTPLKLTVKSPEDMVGRQACPFIYIYSRFFSAVSLQVQEQTKNGL